MAPCLHYVSHMIPIPNFVSSRPNQGGGIQKSAGVWIIITRYKHKSGFAVDTIALPAYSAHLERVLDCCAQ